MFAHSSSCYSRVFHFPHTPVKSCRSLHRRGAIRSLPKTARWRWPRRSARCAACFARCSLDLFTGLQWFSDPFDKGKQSPRNMAPQPTTTRAGSRTACRVASGQKPSSGSRTRVPGDSDGGSSFPDPDRVSPSAEVFPLPHPRLLEKRHVATIFISDSKAAGSQCTHPRHYHHFNQR